MNKFLVCSVCVLALGAFTAGNAEPLRKCNFYEVMNDDDGDGLVQDPKTGLSVCYYTQQDRAAAEKAKKTGTATRKNKQPHERSTGSSNTPVGQSAD